MPVQAQHAVAACHDDVQVVADEQNAALARGPEFGNEIIELSLAFEINATRWFVEHDELGVAHQGARQKDALGFATREIGYLAIYQAASTHLIELRFARCAIQRPREAQKPTDSQRNGPIDFEPLGHIARAQIRPPDNFAAINVLKAEQHARHSGFTGTVWADQCDDFTGRHVHVDFVDHDATLAFEAQVAPNNEAVGWCHEPWRGVAVVMAWGLIVIVIADARVRGARGIGGGRCDLSLSPVVGTLVRRLDGSRLSITQAGTGALRVTTAGVVR